MTSPGAALPGVRVALVVATGDYADPAFSRLGATAQDVDQMTAVLGDPAIGGFDVSTVIDRGEREIRERVEEFLSVRRPGDMVVVYLSCHGLLDAQDHLYFAAADTRQSRLASTAVEAEWLANLLEACRATSQVVILDCCFSGAFAKGAKGADDGLRLAERLAAPGRGRAVLTASRATEQSWEGDLGGGVTGPSAFTSALARGLRTGAADLDGDGYISVDDAYAYAYDEVIASGARQTPQRNITGAEGTLWLARNPTHPGPAPAPPPAHPDPVSRAPEHAPIPEPPVPARPAPAPAPAPAAGGGPPGSTVIPDPARLPGAGQPRGRKRRKIAWTAAACAATAAALIAVLINQNDSGGPRPPAAKAEFVDSGVSHGFDDPDAIAVNGTRVWVASVGTNSVTELNASDGSLIRTLDAASYHFQTPAAIAVDGDHLWVANEIGGSVTELNTSNGSLVKTLDAASYHFQNPKAIAVDGAQLWVLDQISGSVTELNAADGSLVRVLIGSRYGLNSPAAIAADGTHLWIANAAGSVAELNAADGSLVRVLSSTRYGFYYPSVIAADGTHVWVGNAKDSVTELNASDGSLARVLDEARYRFIEPNSIAAGGGRVWVANKGGNSVTELNASDGSLVRILDASRYRFSEPDAIALGGGHVWVANADDNSVTKLPAR